MNEEKDIKIKDKIIEKTIKIEEIPKINPKTISKIILNDGTILVVETNSMANKENELKNINDIGASDNLKTKKEKKLFSYVEWDFPNTKKSFQRNSISELIAQNTNDNNEKNENNNKRENSRDSAINRNIKIKNYSFYESKHLSNKKINNNNSEIEYKNSSCFIKNDNFKEIETNNNDGEKKEIENNVNNVDNPTNNKISNIEKQEELVDINNSEQKDLNIKEQENINNCSNKNKKDNLSFGEKIKLIKYGLLENDTDFNSSLMGLKNDEKDNNSIQKINKIKPLNIDLDKNKNKNQEDINKQFNKLLQKFNENKKENNKKMFEDNSYLLYKTKGKDSSLSGLNGDINQLNNFINRGKYNNINSKKENNKGNSYRDLNERINQLRKKTLSNNFINFIPTRNSNSKLLVLPSNF